MPEFKRGLGPRGKLGVLIRMLRHRSVEGEMKRACSTCLLAALVVFQILWPVVSSHAATIEVVRSGEQQIVIITGPLLIEDGKIFADKVEGLNRAIVVLHSPGGKLLTGLRIGKIINLKRFDTLVPDGFLCASACALAWIGGSTRTVGSEARIGFHAAYREANGVVEETGAGNALVGAYLNHLGLSDKAILYLTAKPPDDMLWLSPSMARDLGIKMVVLTPSETSRIPDAPIARASPQPNSPPPAKVLPTRTDLDSVARSFVTSYFAHWSESNADALRFFRSAYAQKVRFFDRSIDARVLLDEKRKFAERWPERIYAALPETIKTRCDPDTATCEVTGQVQWDCRSPEANKGTVGIAEFTFQLAVSSRGVRINGEWSSVVSHQVRDLSSQIN